MRRNDSGIGLGYPIDEFSSCGSITRFGRGLHGSPSLPEMTAGDDRQVMAMVRLVVYMARPRGRPRSTAILDNMGSLIQQLSLHYDIMRALHSVFAILVVL
jgi:hypothetical protein